MSDPALCVETKDVSTHFLFAKSEVPKNRGGNLWKVTTNI